MNRISKSIIGVGVSVASTFALASQVMADELGIEGTVEIPEGFFFTDAEGLVSTILRAVMLIAGLLVFAYLIWGGIEWITSGGDKGKTENARNKITAAVIGLVILAASYAIFQIVLSLLGVQGYKGIFG
jgi:hypothetical protein